jgi:hypothetical protein
LPAQPLRFHQSSQEFAQACAPGSGHKAGVTRRGNSVFQLPGATG